MEPEAGMGTAGAPPAAHGLGTLCYPGLINSAVIKTKVQDTPKSVLGCLNDPTVVV